MLIVSAANANDSNMLEDIPAIRMPTSRGRRRLGKLHADEGVRHEALCDRVG